MLRKYWNPNPRCQESAKKSGIRIRQLFWRIVIPGNYSHATYPHLILAQSLLTVQFISIDVVTTEKDNFVHNVVVVELNKAESTFTLSFIPQHLYQVNIVMNFYGVIKFKSKLIKLNIVLTNLGESRILLLNHKYPPLFLFLCLFQVRLSKVQVCPAGLGKGYNQAPAGLEAPAGVRIRKKRKIQNKGGGLFVLQDHNTGEYRQCYQQRSFSTIWIVCLSVC